MSEKETPETIEEQNQVEVSEETQEVKAAEEMQTSEAETHEEEAAEETQERAEEAQAEEADIESAAEVPAPKKGLMERRESFDQSSVPNAHKGYSGTPPIIMLLIVSAFVVVSLIFATAAVVN